jgi:membrane-associated phospholipid phosphatase
MRGTGLCLALLLLGPLARAEDAPKKLEIEPTAAPDYITIGAAAGLMGLFNLIHPINPQPSGQNAFDEAARSAVRLQMPTARFAIRDVSDLTLGILLLAPLAGDALLNVAWHRDSPKTGFRMVVVQLETFAITGAVQGLTTMLASRERPYGRTCGVTTPEEARDCQEQGRYRSFYSGHAAWAFAGASLTCSQHVRYALFGGGAPEGVTCAAAYTLAVATSLFRMMGDMHYATDVLTGAGLGTLLGLFMPWLHEQVWRPKTGIGEVTVRVTPTGSGLGVSGTW